MKKLILLALFLLPAVSAQCAEINFPSYLELKEGISFSRNISLPNTSFTYSLVDDMPGFSMKDGYIDFTPGEEDVGEKKVFLLAYTEDCHDSVLVRFNVLDKPQVIPSPARVTDAREGKGVNFQVKIEDSDSDTHEIEWVLDSQEVSTGTRYTFVPGFNDSGRHFVKVTAKDPSGLSGSYEWEFSVKNINRPPVLIENIPGLIMIIDDSSAWADLNDYFIDPDLDDLSFSFKPVDVVFDTPLKITDIALSISNSVATAASSPKPGYRFFKFTATDPFGGKAESNNVRVEARRSITYTPSLFCGDEVCTEAESCNTCALDCGPCTITCTPDWQCTEWEACQPSGLQTRTCVDVKDCRTNLNKPVEARECNYVATCKDRIKNQNETEVDCGGPCETCPTCFDGIKNQGETGIDCGGPCQPCPTCDDNIRNQNETDIDCGGNCGGCGPGRTCRTNIDCYSLICEEGFCQFGSCTDGIKNQGEQKIDCGGPCHPCPSCFDGIKNQGEEKTDCGGANCSACMTCSDGIKNQGEKLADCGGPCGRCLAEDYLNYLEFKNYFFIFIAVSIIIIFGLRAFVNSDMYYDMSHGGFFSFFERDRHLKRVMRWNRVRRHLRLRKGLHDNQDATKQVLSELRNATPEKEEISSILTKYFRAILPVQKAPTYEQIDRAIKTSNNAFLVKTMLVILLRKTWYLKMESMMLSGEAARIRRECINILKELERDV